MRKRNIIFLPGYYGSKFKLKSTGETIWLDFNDLFKPSKVMGYLRLDQEPDPVELSGILDTFDILPFLRVNFYKSFFKWLTRTVGYNPSRVHRHAVDWRQSLSFSADRLHQYIRNNIEGDEKFDLIAHSHGGLVCRAFLTKYGGNRVNRLITLGTPHRGMLKVFQALNHGIELQTFAPHHTKEPARTMPSAYELLPRFAADEMFNWNGLASDPFSQKGWVQHEANPEKRENMLAKLVAAEESTRAFLPDSIDVEAYFIFGTRLDTMSIATGDPTNPVSFEGDGDKKPVGDTTVTTISADGRGITGDVTRIPAPYANHTRMLDDRFVRKILKKILHGTNPFPRGQVIARWEGNPDFYFANEKTKLTVEIRDTKGNPIHDATANLRIQIGRRSNSATIFPMNRTREGDFFIQVNLPMTDSRVMWRVEVDGTGVHKDSPGLRGIKRMR